VHLRRLSEELTSRYYVVGRETLFRSPVALTPYQSEERIDDAKLRAIIDDAYQQASISAKDIDTGVVILTGEALRRDNAQAIASLLAEQGGDFVTATAGHHMEAMLAGYGSGAARISSDQGKRILNIDIGGGTTKLALVENGRVTATAAIHVGGRLQVVDDSGRIVRLDPAGQHHAAQAGFHWHKGDSTDPAALDKVAEYMADALIAAIRMRPLPPPLLALYLTEPIADLTRIDGVMVSGGVGEYVYGRESRDFGDMGRRLGHAMRKRLDAGALPWPLLPAGECIRATALGASEYSVQLSGNTSTITDPGALLPRRNLQVLAAPYVCEETIDPDKLAAAIRGHFTAFDLTEGESIGKLAGAVAERWEKLDILVLNAAMLGSLSPVQDIDPKEYSRLLSLNLLANQALIAAFDPLLKNADRADIVALTSSVGSEPRAFWGAYGSSKAALETLLRAYADEVEYLGRMKVHIIDPGATRTRMRALAFPGEEPESVKPPGVVARGIIERLSDEAPTNTKVRIEA